MVKVTVEGGAFNKYPKLMQHVDGCIILVTAPYEGVCVKADEDTELGEHSESWSLDDCDWAEFTGSVTLSNEV